MSCTRRRGRTAAGISVRRKRGPAGGPACRRTIQRENRRHRFWLVVWTASTGPRVTPSIITDYKTGRPKSQEDADKSLQLSVYALAARENVGISRRNGWCFTIWRGIRRSAPRAVRSRWMTRSGKWKRSPGKSLQGSLMPSPASTAIGARTAVLCPQTERRIATTDSDASDHPGQLSFSTLSSAKKLRGRFSRPRGFTLRTGQLVLFLCGLFLLSFWLPWLPILPSIIHGSCNGRLLRLLNV